MIPYGRQSIADEDIKAVVDVLRSDYITQGPVVPLFENAVASYCGAEYGVAVNSATSALHLACRSLNLGPGDIFWTSPNTFVASANCGLYCGAQVDFVDIDPHTYNISIKALSEKLSAAESEGKLPKVVIPVHFAGQSCDMEAIAMLAKRYGFAIIEDASHAIGGKYKGVPVGSCQYSDITVFSFHPVKIITTGEGGIALTNNSELYKKIVELRSHGITRNHSDMTDVSHGPWYYQQIDLGYNYRMTDIQAALGLSQMGRLDEFVSRRNEIAAYYDSHISALPVLKQSRSKDIFSAFHLYVICLKKRNLSSNRKAVFEALRESGINVNVHYIPVHMHPYYNKLGFNVGDFPVSENYYRDAISLPIFPQLKDEEIDFVVSALRKALM